MDSENKRIVGPPARGLGHVTREKGAHRVSHVGSHNHCLIFVGEKGQHLQPLALAVKLGRRRRKGGDRLAYAIGGGFLGVFQSCRRVGDNSAERGEGVRRVVRPVDGIGGDHRPSFP